MTDKWKHIRPTEYDWDYFKDVNGRETSMVRTLITGDESVSYTHLTLPTICSV